MKLKIFFIILTLNIISSCNEQSSTSMQKSKIINSELKNYSFGKLYRDIENKFRIQYPNNWELVSGEAKHTVVKFINRDSSMSLSINVMDNDGSIMEDKLTDAQLNEKKTQFIKLFNSAKKAPIGLTVENGFLDNHNALVLSYKSLNQQINVEFFFKYYQIQTLKDERIYTISLIVPDKYYSETFKSYINNFLYTFSFDPA